MGAAHLVLADGLQPGADGPPETDHQPAVPEPANPFAWIMKVSSLPLSFKPAAAVVNAASVCSWHEVCEEPRKRNQKEMVLEPAVLEKRSGVVIQPRCELLVQEEEVHETCGSVRIGFS